MSLILNHNIPVNTLLLNPEIIVWHAKIPDILQSVCCKATYHNSRPMVNEIFQKDHFTPTFLNAREIETLNSFKALKKQIEWSCGRYLVKAMVQQLFLTSVPLDAIQIGYLDQGAPVIETAPKIQISLSHSNLYTVVACAETPGRSFGIDIEKVGELPNELFLKTAFTQTEIQHLDGTADHVFKNWTIKEAYLKYIKKGFNESLHAVEVIHDQIFHSGKKTDLSIASVCIDGYAVSLVSGPAIIPAPPDS